MKMIEGNVREGAGLAGAVGYPTVNVDYRAPNISKCGAYFINNDKYGRGVAWVTPVITEIHFLNPITMTDAYIVCNVEEKILIPDGAIADRRGLLYYFYMGILGAMI